MRELPVPAANSPTVRQRRLRVELRKSRDEAAFTQEQVAGALDWSVSKVIRIESGKVRVAITDLKAMLSLYGVSERRIRDLVELARQAREHVWWNDYRKLVQPPYYNLIGYESGAGVIRQYENAVVPGLLQTREYAREYIRISSPQERENLNELVALCMRRQEILDHEDPPWLFFVLDESVVQRQIGGAHAMRDQLHHLIELADRPRITIEVVPFSVGRRPSGSFIVFEFPSPEDEDVLHLENAKSIRAPRYTQGEIATYRADFESLRKMSLRPEETTALLHRLADKLPPS